MRRPLKDDWFTFTVRFVCGALLGLVVGFLIFTRVADLGHSGAWWIAGAAFTLGLAAAYWGDSFWESLGRWFFWWLP